MADKKDVTDPILDRLAELDRLIEEQKARMAAAPAPAGLGAEALTAILAQQAKTTAEIAQAARPVRHSNADHLHVSAFSNPRGDLADPKPKLTRETFFNHHRESADDLTPAEVAAYNAVTHSCEARDGQWTATVRRNQLFIHVPSHTTDERMDLPNGLVLILRELADGPKAVDPADMLVRIAALEAQLAAQTVPA